MKSCIHILATLFCGLCLLSTVSSAATYYVAPSASGGLDSNPGSLSQPWLTFEKAAATMVPGDTTLFRAGTYNLSSTIHPRSGTSGNPITFKAYPGESVTANGGSHGCFTLPGISYITFDGLRMTSSNPNVGAFIIYMEDTHDCSFLNCEFFGLPVQAGAENSAVIRCMAGGRFSTNCTFRNNTFRDNASPCMRLYKTDGWVIENNEFRNSPEFVGGKDEPHNMIVRRNLFVDCKGVLNGGGGVFYFAGQYGFDNVTITENIAYNCDMPVLQLGGQGTGGAYRQDMKFFNNAFYECRSFILGWDDGFMRNHNYYNNIVYSVTSENLPPFDDTSARILNMNRWGSTPMNPAHYYFDYNCLQIPAGDASQWFNNAQTAYTLAQWKAARVPFEAHSISANPLFVNASAGNFQLQSGSPCIGTGRNGENMGAYPRGNDGTIIGRITGSGDITAPVVSITAPAHGATVSGASVLVSANATDNVGVAGVQFKLDGANLGTEDTASPFSINWNTTSVTNGNHTLSAVARDAAGNTKTAANISVTVSNSGPEVNVTGNSVTIADGDTTPATTDQTDFGSLNPAGQSLTKTYTIQNTGLAALTVNAVTVSGINASDFSVMSQPAASVVAGGSTTFTVKFDPRVLGTRSAVLSFASNDADESPYNFAIQGRGDLIVDNADASGVSLTGSWILSSFNPASNYFGANYRHDDNAGKGLKSARFTPTLPAAGSYEVFLRWPAATNRASNVPVDVVTAGGTVVPLEVDQKINGGVWNSLGVYSFNAGTEGSVLISNTGTTDYVVADAVMFVPAEVIVDNLDTANVVKTGTWVTSTSAPGFQGSNYLHDDNSGKGSKSFRFVPDLPTAGNYEVFTRWTSAANRASNVPVDIVTAGGTVVPRQVDQRVNGGAWVSLGIHPFNAGTSGSVLISNTGTAGFVIVDAVRWIKRP